MKDKSHKKKEKKRGKFPFPAIFSTVLILVTVFGLSYMRLNSQCDTLGREIKQKEHELEEAQKRLINEQDRWSFVTSPAKLQQSIEKFHLEMSMPSDAQIVRVRYERDTGLGSLAYNK